jgi:short-subunit dehydrogenase
MTGTAVRGVLWVTGASSGIGAAIARELALLGYPVAASARRSAPLQRLARHGVFPLPCDCSDPDAVAAAVSTLQERFGRIGGLIHSAGEALFKPFVEFTLEEFERLLANNVRTMYLCLHSVLPLLRQQRSGLVIAIGSVAAEKPFAYSSVYGAAKAAVAQLLRAVREEVRSEGIKVINLLVGATATPLWSASVRRRYRHRMLQPRDVADAVAALVRLSSLPQALPEELWLRPQRGDLP